jgi:hypothetical protein
MMHSALLVMAQQAFVQHRMEPLFCSQALPWARAYLRTWRSTAGCGCR